LAGQDSRKKKDGKKEVIQFHGPQKCDFRR
jgi:hypothetical protein